MDRVLHTVLFEESLTMEGGDASGGRGQSLSLSLSLYKGKQLAHIVYRISCLNNKVKFLVIHSGKP